MYIYIYIHIYYINTCTCIYKWVATKPLWWQPGGHIVFMIAFILRPPCFFEIWVLCVSWIIYDHLYYALCLAFWALCGSLMSAMCNSALCAQVYCKSILDYNKIETRLRLKTELYRLDHNKEFIDWLM